MDTTSIKESLSNLNTLLGSIEVKGKQNLDRLLASILLTEKITALVNTQEAEIQNGRVAE